MMSSIRDRLPKNWKATGLKDDAEYFKFHKLLLDESTPEGKWLKGLHRLSGTKMSIQEFADKQLFNDDYDLPNAIRSGERPSINKHDNMYHWHSKNKKGEWLKSPNHPTAWMEIFMELTQKDPQDIGINTEQEADRYLLAQKNKQQNDIRVPYQSEIDYFRQNRHVGGMATSDDKVILNPYTSLSKKEKDAIVQNERARIFMRNLKHRPFFELTPEQERRFKSYSKNIQDIRETIIARILSDDPSAGTPTEQQRRIADDIKREMSK